VTIESETYVRELITDSRYDDPKRLERYGYKMYSQNDEDGIIEEIFKRIGTTSKTFVEFGVENEVREQYTPAAVGGLERALDREQRSLRPRNKSKI